LSGDESAQPALLELTGSIAAQRAAGVNVTGATEQPVRIPLQSDPYFRFVQRRCLGRLCAVVLKIASAKVGYRTGVLILTREPDHLLPF
jgi:hypothetical protein